MRTERFIEVKWHDAIGIIVLNRPHVLNAWHWRMREGFIAALPTLEKSDAVRAVILTGAGDRAFCAGQDLSEMESLTSEDVEQWVRQWERLYGQVRSLTKPSIAALNGAAVGSAFHVALLCDFRIAHFEVRVGQPDDQFCYCKRSRPLDHAGNAWFSSHGRANTDWPVALSP